MNKLYFSWCCIALASLGLLASACDKRASVAASPAASQPPRTAVSSTSATPTDSPAPDKPEQNVTKSIVVYFSKTGTTETLAKAIQRETKGEIYRIVPAQPYPEDYHTTTELAQKEFRDSIYPDYNKDTDIRFESYSTIYVGYPIWWGRAPMIVQNFLLNQQLTGKRIIPFTTFHSSGLGTSVEDIQNSAGKAIVVTDALGVRTSDVATPSAAERVKTWVKSHQPSESN